MEHHIPEIDRFSVQVAPILDSPLDKSFAAVGLKPGDRFPVAEIQDAGGDEEIVPFHGQILKTTIPEVLAEGRRKGRFISGSGSSRQ